MDKRPYVPSDKEKRKYKIMHMLVSSVISLYMLAVLAVPFSSGNVIYVLKNAWGEQTGTQMHFRFFSSIFLVLCAVTEITDRIKLMRIRDDRKYANNSMPAGCFSFSKVVFFAIYLVTSVDDPFFPISDFVSNHTIVTFYTLGLFIICLVGGVVRRSYRDVELYYSNLTKTITEENDAKRREETESANEEIESEYRQGCEQYTEGKTSKASDLDALLKYKKLLDDGVITQEEFDKKKEELLK